MKSYKITVLVFVFLAMFVSCDSSGNFVDSTYTNDFSSNAENSSYTKIYFSYSQPGSLSRGVGLDADDDIQPNEIIYREIERQDAPLLRKPLANGRNSLMLPKGKNYLVGFVYNPNLDPDDTKDLPYIKVVGGLEVVNSNLSGTIPTTAETDSEIDLGDLSKGETGLETEVTLDDFSSMVGYSPEALTSFGVFDDSLLKYLNPDINRNGLYDEEEEGLGWLLTPCRDYLLYLDDFSSEGPILSIDRFEHDNFEFVFWFTRDSLTYVRPEETFLKFPSNATYFDDDRSVTGIKAYHTVPQEFIYQQYYFKGLSEVRNSYRRGFDGEYQITLGIQNYYFGNFSFMSPSKDDFEGFLFPQTECVFDDDGYLLTIKYTWWIIKDGVYVTPSNEDIKLRLGIPQALYFYLPENKGWIVSAKEIAVSGQVDVSVYRVHFDELVVGDSSRSSMSSNYRDTAGNNWSFTNYVEE